MEKGKIIVLEGACDGIGKSTQLKLLKNHLTSDGEIVKTHHFPTYGTPQGKIVEMYLGGEFGEDVSKLSPYFVHSLYAVDRAITWYLSLKEIIEKGETLVLDRYTTSSILYQSVVIEDMDEKKRFIDFVCDYEYHKLGVQEPDHIIFLHAPFELIQKIHGARKTNDGLENDIHERNTDYMKRIYENAMFLADYLDWDKIDCSRMDQMRSIEEIHEEVYQKIKKR